MNVYLKVITNKYDIARKDTKRLSWFIESEQGKYLLEHIIVDNFKLTLLDEVDSTLNITMNKKGCFFNKSVGNRLLQNEKYLKKYEVLVSDIYTLYIMYMQGVLGSD